MRDLKVYINRLLSLNGIIPAIIFLCEQLTVLISEFHWCRHAPGGITRG